MKKGFIIAAAVLIATGLALFTGAFIASGFDFSKLGTAKYETNTYTVGEDFERIEINSKETDIIFKPSADGKFSVVCVEREKVRHMVSVENGTMKISADDKREWYDHLTLFSKALSMTVYLPSDHYDSLLIDSRTGDVTIPDPFSFGDIDVAVSTGDVVCGASASGLFKVKTSTGDIRLDKVSARQMELSVFTGSIDVVSVTSEETISIEVGTGKTKLTDMICKSLHSKGRTGDITLKNVVASDSLNIEMGTGNVCFENCDAGSITARTSTGDVTGTLRTEKVFIAKASTGTVHVPDTISGGRCEITTSTGNINIELSDI